MLSNMINEIKLSAYRYCNLTVVTILLQKIVTSIIEEIKRNIYILENAHLRYHQPRRRM